ncbi:AraC family transcriptional regulator [Aquimarina algiphila]|uniref:AraC family transcriptional regulator n=1 Tax=Aquimarina algiphila TaxID=2047982 RepID=UPI00249029CC|nr:AraC family transcriptional regulator [Aquimarina algiphila]
MKKRNQDVMYYEDSSIRITRKNYVKFENDMLPHDHDFLSISLMLSGSLIEHTEKGTTIVKPGSILIKPAQLEHSNIFTESCTILSLNIYDWEYYKFDYKNWDIIQRHMLLKYFLRIIQDKDKKQSLSTLKSNLSPIADTKHIQESIPEWIKHVRTIIDAQFLEPLKISELAKQVNVHPVHLGRTFKNYYKIDIKTYQKQLRMYFAVSQMITQNDNLTQIAHSTGYADQSHFTREFKKSTDFSPKKIATLLNV